MWTQKETAEERRKTDASRRSEIGEVSVSNRMCWILLGELVRDVHLRDEREGGEDAKEEMLAE